ncbi:putative gamma-glutamylcyclotransferase At3g02910 [Wolffia australiana]
MQSRCCPSSVVLPRASRGRIAETRTLTGAAAEGDSTTKTKTKTKTKTLVFTYGTLKQGFSNHGLVQEMIHAGEASFVGIYRTADRFPLVCGPYRVPFLLNIPGKGQQVWGELYEVSSRAIERMDELEGTSSGHYERLPVLVAGSEIWTEDDAGDDGDLDDGSASAVRAEAYFAHRSYAGELWRCTGERGYCVYSEKEARGYVRRKDRPQGLSFLDHIQAYVSAA